MLKSSMKNKVLVSSFLIIIVSSFVPYLGRSTTGESLPPHFHSPTLESWINGTWQNEFEKFRDRNFGFRNSWVRCKNFIYYMLNFGQFHSSYNGSIYQGRSGFLFERYYLTNQFNWSNSDLNFNWLHFNLNKVSELKLQLSNYDVTLFFNLFPNKASQLQSQWPFLWDLQKNIIQALLIITLFGKLLHNQSQYLHSICSHFSISHMKTMHIIFPNLGHIGR